MSLAIDRIAEIAGAPIVEGGRIAFLQALQDKNLPIPSEDWYSHAVAGKMGGSRFALTLELSAADPNNSSKKDLLYRRVATEGLFVRRYSGEKAPPGEDRRHYSSFFFSESIAESLASRVKGITTPNVRDIFAGMRADLVFGNPPIDSQVQAIFLRTANEYLTAYTDARFPARVRESVEALKKSWDGESAKSFFKTFDSVMIGGCQLLATWAPYQVDVAQKFYELRTPRNKAKLKSNPKPTPFDERVLSSRSPRDYKKLEQEVREETGVRVDAEAIVTHRNALLFGNPLPPFSPWRDKN